MASLDTGGPQCIAPVLQALHGLIGFDAGCYIHTDAGTGGEGELHVHMENPAMQAAMPDYFDPRILKSELQVLHRSSQQMAETLRLEWGVRMLPQMVKVPLPELLRSDFYNVVLRPGGVGDCMSLVLRTPQGEGIGTFKLYRQGWSRPFTPQDAAALERLHPSLARALQPGELDAADTEIGAQGLLVATPAGRLQWASPGADALMALAFGARWRSRLSGSLPPAVQLLLQRLFWPQHPPDGGEAPPPLPQLELRNANGWFSLRATHLAAAGGGVGEAAAIHITQRVARGARLQAALRALGLPRRQQELAYWLARGLAEPHIAERMGVSINTVAYHRRQLYAALGVQNRQALAARLTTPQG